MVIVNYQFGRVQHHLEDWPLGKPVPDYLDCVNCLGNPS